MLHRRHLIAAASAGAVLGSSSFARASQESELIALRPSRYPHSRIGASVSIDGQGPFIFVVDSGSQRSMVADSLVQRLGLASTGRTEINGVTAPAELPTVEVGQLDFGRKAHAGLSLPVARRDLLAAEGLIGLDVLSQFRLIFHIDRGEAEVMGAELEFNNVGPTDETGTNIPPRWHRAGRARSGQLVVRAVTVGGVRCRAFVDNGAQHSVGNGALHTALSRGRDPRVGPSTPVRIYDVPGLTRSAERAVVDTIQLPGRPLGETSLLFADLHVFDGLGIADTPSLLIGADLMSQFRRVVLDYPLDRMAFILPSAEAEAGAQG